MEKKKNNLIVMVFMVIIILILLILFILFANGKLIFTDDSSKEINDSGMQDEAKKDYNDFIGTWRNIDTLDELTIKSITDEEIIFTWFVHKTASIDNDTTISFENGKGIFYFQGYDDKNYDNIETEEEKYMRKATIELADNGVNVIVEDVTSIDSNYKLLDDFGGSVYIIEGTYTHSEKYK